MVVLALVGGAAASGAGQSSLPVRADTALVARLSPAVRAVVAPIVDSARAARLPVQPLLDKALEGQTKGAPADRIGIVVRQLAVLMSEAGSALGSNASPMEIGAGASALHAGARPDVLARLKAARPRQSVAVALGVMSELVARGVSPDTAASAVLALATRGATDEELVALRQEVDVDLAAGVPPSVSAAQRAADGAASSFQPSASPTVANPSTPTRPPPPRPTRP